MLWWLLARCQDGLGCLLHDLLHADLLLVHLLRMLVVLWGRHCERKPGRSSSST
jgi:hypothetical protein